MSRTLICKTTLNNLPKIFKSASENLVPNQWHFKEVRIEQHPNEREFILSGNSFANITFNTFYAASGIRKIDINAFKNTNNKLKAFYCLSCQLVNESPNYDLQIVFNQMINLQTISTEFSTVLPDLHLTKLSNLVIKSHQNWAIKSGAFQNLNQLSNLVIYETNILRFEKDAFKFDQSLNQRLKILFERCTLTGK